MLVETIGSTSSLKEFPHAMITNVIVLFLMVKYCYHYQSDAQAEHSENIQEQSLFFERDRFLIHGYCWHNDHRQEILP